MSTTTVGSSAALTAALKSAKAGDTIQLQSGTYSGLELKYLNLGAGVTITSLDPSHKAVLTNFTVWECTGLNFSNLEVQVTGTGSYGVNVYNSNTISFDKMYVHGSLDGNAGNDPGGIGFLSTSNVKVTNSEFTQLFRAAGAGTGDNVTFAENNVHGMSQTGFVFSGVNNVKVTGNVIADVRPINGDHPDAIQFFTSGRTAAVRDIVISDNLILRGAGDATQGIFMRDETGKLPYQNVTITNNMVVGTGYGGIYVDGAKGLTISGNELLSNPGDTNRTFLLTQRVDNAVVTNNKAVVIGYDAVTNLTQSGNVVTTAVADGGESAVTRWLALHPEDASTLAALRAASPNLFSASAAPVAPPAPVPPPAPAPAPAPAAALAVTTPAAATVDTSPIAKMGAADKTLVLSKAWQVDGVGNALDNVITGNWKNNALSGNGGNDTLDGQGGADTLSGGVGNDTYIVPNSQAVIVEKAGEGIDTVIARGDHTLAANVENLVISQTSGWSGTGNVLNNIITGNAGDNTLKGEAGSDTLNGGAGQDWILGGTGDDRLTGGTGVDQFTFTPGGGKDVITDFGAGGEHDRIDILAYIKAGMAPTVTDTGPDVRISFTNGDSITVLGIEPAAMKAWYAGWVF